MMFERNSSHSWWWNSHNAPRQPGWLQSALGEIDGKTKAMLKLIEEDADSFAQRAEMYYKKRPELISLVEEFYRAYRALAERYDLLNGAIRQGIPKVVQVQYGISDETTFEFPFGKQNLPCKHESRGFHKFLGRQESCGSDSEASEVDDSEYLRTLSSSGSEVENPPQEVAENGRDGSGRKTQATLSNLREEMPRLLKQSSSAASLQSEHLTDEINTLKRERNSMKEEMSLIIQEKDVLEKELDKFKAENKVMKKQNENTMQRMQALGKSVDNLQAEHRKLSKQNKIISTVLGFVSGQAASLARSNAKLRNEMCQGNQQSKAIFQILKDEKTKIENLFEAEVKKVSELNLTIDVLQREVYSLREEKKQQRVVAIGQNGEKKEAKRQHCVIDDHEPNYDGKNDINKSDGDSDDLGPVSSYESEVDDPPPEVAENKWVDSRMREMQSTISSLQEDKARLLKRLSAKRLQSKHLKDEINNLNNERNIMKEEMSQVVQANGVLEKELQEFKTGHDNRPSRQNEDVINNLNRERNFMNEEVSLLVQANGVVKKELQEFRTEHDKILRNQGEDAMQWMQAPGKDAISTILGFVDGRAASLKRNNERWINEMGKSDQQCKALLQIPKDKKMNFENMFETEVGRISKLELILAIDELQGEVCRLREENWQQKIALVDQNEEKREAIRQLSFAMDILRDNNHRLQETVRGSRGGGPSQISRWKKLLYATLECTILQS